jgi:hypothetical protein
LEELKNDSSTMAFVTRYITYSMRLVTSAVTNYTWSIIRFIAN